MYLPEFCELFVKFTESVVPIVLKSFGQDIPNLFLDERYNLDTITNEEEFRKAISDALNEDTTK